MHGSSVNWLQPVDTLCVWRTSHYYVGTTPGRTFLGVNIDLLIISWELELNYDTIQIERTSTLENVFVFNRVEHIIYQRWVGVSIEKIRYAIINGSNPHMRLSKQKYIPISYLYFTYLVIFFLSGMYFLDLECHVVIWDAIHESKRKAYWSRKSP